MKGCYVISEWVGTGTDEDPQRPLVADVYPCSCTDVTGQYVRLDKGSPSPNIAVFKVVELRSPKHDGRIEAIKADPRFCVLEEWDGLLEKLIPVQTVSDKDVENFLSDRGVTKAVTDLVKGDRRVSRAKKLFKDFEKPHLVVEMLSNGMRLSVEGNGE